MSEINKIKELLEIVQKKSAEIKNFSLEVDVSGMNLIDFSEILDFLNRNDFDYSLLRHGMFATIVINKKHDKG